jgi:uncharacterized membrane protein YdbT with pleckstrin-like domain
MSFAKKQLLPGEQLIRVVHQHPLILFKPFLLNLVSLALLVALYVYSKNIWVFAVYTAPLLYFAWEYLSWRKQEYILTDSRVVRQEGVLSISSFDASLDKINNVYHKQSLFGRLLNYGEVGLETASEAGVTIFDFLSNPLSFKNQIVRQRELYRLDRAAGGVAPQANIPQLLNELASLRDRNILTESEFQAKKMDLLRKM